MIRNNKTLFFSVNRFRNY